MDPSGVVVRPASTVIALRSGSEAPEILMVRRGSEAEFLGGAYVFPGGAVDEADSSPLAVQAVRFAGDPAERPWRAAALRELAEEVGIFLTDRPVVNRRGHDASLFQTVIEAGATFAADRLEYLSNWVTPVGPPRRYDTRFFVTILPETARAASDDVEVFDATWVSAKMALGLASAGEWYVEFPTRRHLELLASFATADEAFDHARAATPVRVQPQLAIESDGSWRVLLPGDAGFDAAAS